jgi:hypothetical protein
MLFYYNINTTAAEHEEELKARVRAQRLEATRIAAVAASAALLAEDAALLFPPAQDKPNDREVEELLELFEHTEAPLLRAVDERVHWHAETLPRWVRAMLLLGGVTMTISCTVVRYYGSRCFTVRRSSSMRACCSRRRTTLTHVRAPLCMPPSRSK